ncbi:MAG: penicillin acylase family protein [bacterium]
MGREKSGRKRSGPGRKARRIGTFFYAGGIAGLAAAAAALWLSACIQYRPIPSRLELPGLREPVELLQDGTGTWHIRGEDWHDVLFVQGWLHARDRMWQMEAGRLAGRGRLAELAGSSALPADRLMRTLDLAGAARGEVERLDPEIRGRLQAYVDGVNRALSGPGARRAPELVLLGWEPEPWSLEDSAVLVSLLSVTLSSNWVQEAVRAALEAEFDPAEVALLLPDDREGPWVIREGERGGGDPRFWTRLARAGREALALVGASGPGQGSDAWVAGPARTRSGGAMLANDPHLGIQVPSLWSSVGLHPPGRHLVGVSLPGLPGVVIGRTPRFAWGLTNTMGDNQDLYIERPAPERPDHYLIEGRELPFATRQETLEVRWGEEEVLTLRSTVHGPVINHIVDAAAGFKEEAASGESLAGGGPAEGAAGWAEGAPPVSLRWAGREAGNELTALALLLEARGLEDLRAAFRHFGSPGQNVLYADEEGRIAYQFTGVLPVREGWDGSRPVPGWDGEHEWEGWIPYEELPALTDPDRGYLASANNRPLPAGEGPLLARWFMPPHRARRIETLLEARGDHDVESFTSMQRDVVSVGAGEILGDLRRLGPTGPSGRRALRSLEGWDGSVTRYGPSALYEAFLARIFPLVLRDDLGEALYEDWLAMQSFYDGRYPVLRRLLADPDASWWDDRQTADAVEGAAEVVERAWEEALEEVEGRFGPDPSRWEWGRMHRVVFRHPAARFWPLTALMNRGPFPMEGDNETLYNSHWLLGDPYGTTVGSSWRHVVDFGRDGGAWQILPTGNTGHFLAPGYDDQIEEWLEGTLRPAPTTWGEAEADLTRRVELLPPEGGGGR